MPSGGMSLLTLGYRELTLALTSLLSGKPAAILGAALQRPRWREPEGGLRTKACEELNPMQYHVSEPEADPL